MSIPILFIIFNRANTALRVLESIKLAKPKKLYIAQDGPRKIIAGEDLVCKNLRNKIIENINWDCEVITKINTTNMGMKKAVPHAISWLFENENEGIILEDDCLPNQSFFTFCEEVLEKHKDNEEIMHISGNFFQNQPIGDGDYYFSKIPHIWGWATWRRAWEKYDISMNGYQEFIKTKKIKQYFKKDYCATAWKHLFDQVYYNKSQTWDFQWTYCLFKNDGLAITPNKNLVTNIGFGELAENCKNKNDKFSQLDTQELLFPLTHPQEIFPNSKADQYTTKNNFNFTYTKYILAKTGLFNMIQYLYRMIR